MEKKKEIIEKLSGILNPKADIGEITIEVKKLRTEFVEFIKGQHAEEKKEHESSDSREEFKPSHDEWDAHFSELMTNFNERRKKWEDQRLHELNDNLLIKKKIISDLGKMIKEEHHIGHAFEKFNALKDKWTSTGNVPNSDFREIQREYSHLIEEFFYNINIYKSLKEYDLQKNLQLKLELTEKVKSLMNNDAIKEVRDLISAYTHEWDDIGPTYQNKWEKVRDEFWENVREVHKKMGDHYKKQKEKLQENLLDKEKLCEKVEELTKEDLSDIKLWNRTQKELNKIRDDWKKIGFAGKKANDEIWDRFRKGMDAFYSHRKQEQEGIKEIHKSNEEKKLKLIERAEQLKESMDWKNTSETYKKLQADWKRAGSAHPGREQKLWKKFRAPSDHFFERRKDYFDNREEREKNNLKLKEDILKKIKDLKIEKGEKSDDSIQKFVKEWNTVGYVPKEAKNKIDAEFQKALNDKMKSMGMDNLEIESQSYVFKVEGIKESENADELLRNEYRNLADKLRRIETDILQYENNLGFFGGNTDNPLVKEVEKKIESSKMQADRIKERMSLLND